MSAEYPALTRHIINITFHDLPSTAPVRIDFPIDTDAIVPMSLSTPTLSLGASYGGGAMTLSALSLTPRRIQFNLEDAPASLPLTVGLVSNSAFLFGWLQVPGGVQTTIASAVEQIRFVGPGYWAVPLIVAEPVAARASGRAAAAAAPAPFAAKSPLPGKPAAAPKSISTPAAAPAAKADPPPGSP